MRESIMRLLEAVADGTMPVDAAFEELKDFPFQDLTHTKIDHQRHLRKGIGEVIFGEGKTFEQICDIVRSMTEKELDVLATRVDKEKGGRLLESFPEGIYSEAARSFVIQKEKPVRGKGMILIVSAGTSDIPVAEEAYTAATFFGNSTERLYDVGVAGIHRLFANMDLLKKARVIIVAAGMEGALPSDRCGNRGRSGHRHPDERRLRGESRRLRGPSLHAQLVFDRCRLQHRQWVRRGLLCHPGQPPMKLLYLDPIMGISGDMCIAALIDAGCPFDQLMELLRQLPLDLPSMTPEKRRKGAVEGTYLRIGESPVHLSIGQMREMIEGLEIEQRVKADALGILEVLVNGEAKAHGVPAEEVHFHELSHVDTIIDCLCVAKAMAFFAVEEVFCGPLPQGRGLIKTAHGIMPNPPPATTEIVSGLDVLFLDEERELTTPTGAAIARYYTKGRTRPPFRVTGHGYGFGTFETTRPNVLRVFLGESDRPSFDEEVWVAEADMDDMEPEYLGAVADRIRAAGALDAIYFPIQMKKGRPGIRLALIAPLSRLSGLVDLVLRETTTFGVRFRPEFRSVLARKEEVRETSLGPVNVKTGFDRSGKRLKSHVEFEDVKKMADKLGMTYLGLMEALKKEL